MPARYFINRYLSAIPNAGQPISAEWIQQKIAAIVRALGSAKQTTDECDGGMMHLVKTSKNIKIEITPFTIYVAVRFLARLILLFENTIKS